MPSVYEELKKELVSNPKTWLVTGVAGFIGSNLLENLLGLNQRVVGLDNFSTGYQHNLNEVQGLVSSEQWANFHFIEGDIRNIDDCRSAMHFSPFMYTEEGQGERAKPIQVDYVLHQAALGSVPRSIEDPITTNQNNIDGFMNMLVAARDAKVKRFVYAASSSTYGDHPDLPKVEDKIGKPLSPYAVTKLVNELYADVFARAYGFQTIGLRYFNIFGRRQDPNGAYAAVIPKCDRTSLNDLYHHLRSNLAARFPHLEGARPVHRDFRAGDVRHSQADVGRATRQLGYCPTHRIAEGLAESMGWYVKHC